MLPLEVFGFYPLYLSAMVGVVSNWLKPIWVFVLLGVVGLLLYLAMVLPDLPEDANGRWVFLSSAFYYWLGFYLALFAAPFAIGWLSCGLVRVLVARVKRSRGGVARE